MCRLSVVIPAFNEEPMISRTVGVLREILGSAGISWEIVFVDDGSTDQTWEQIGREASLDSRVTGLCFSRNFGKEAAIIAGLAKACGEAVAVMDCDLQHPPELLPEMFRLWEEGYEIVEGVKEDRGEESLFHKRGAGLFYRLMSRAVGVDMKNSSDFKLLDQKAVQSILSMPERNMFFRAASSWVGYRTVKVPFEVQARETGQSKWSVRSLFGYAFTNIVSFTTVPLQFVTIGGTVCLVLSLILTVYSLIQYFSGHAVEGYTTILIVLLFIGSSVMMSLGVIGYYIARIFEEVKSRPRYIVSRVLGGNRRESSEKAADHQTQFSGKEEILEKYDSKNI
ncbi:MAG: glycosyltransferase family 2 protein [Clostridiales bacterium]|nr:glycosyltransferase family 2 protein [Clostridiales bacterium]